MENGEAPTEDDCQGKHRNNSPQQLPTHTLPSCSLLQCFRCLVAHEVNSPKVPQSASAARRRPLVNLLEHSSGARKPHHGTHVEG